MIIMWLYKYAKRRTTSIFTISVVRLFMFNHNRSLGKRGLHFQMTDLRLSRCFCVSSNHHFLSVDNVDAFGSRSGYAAALQVVPYGCGKGIGEMTEIQNMIIGKIDAQIKTVNSEKAK